MNIWPEDVLKPITIIASENATISIYSRLKASSAPYSALPGIVEYKGNDTWELLVSFNAGDYVVKVIVIDNGITIPIYQDLSVRSLEEVNHTINQELIKSAINDVSNKITTTKSWKGIG